MDDILKGMALITMLAWCFKMGIEIATLLQGG